MRKILIAAVATGASMLSGCAIEPTNSMARKMNDYELGKCVAAGYSACAYEDSHRFNKGEHSASFKSGAAHELISERFGGRTEYYNNKLEAAFALD